MSIDAIKDAVVKTINLSNYQIKSIINKSDGLEINIYKTNKYGYYNTIQTFLRNKDDIDELRDTVGIKMN